MLDKNPANTPPSISRNQWTPQKTLAVPTTSEQKRNASPNAKLKNKRKKEIPKKKDEWPDGKEEFFGTGIKTFVFGNSAGLFSL